MYEERLILSELNVMLVRFGDSRSNCLSNWSPKSAVLPITLTMPSIWEKVWFICFTKSVLAKTGFGCGID
ncbi:hypothetical protein BpHYR1_020792 [Brachionus plicatilis]|uniref:Uncharacterized protein n=1 Tax=Brachionus plicatilis TaxID=10195 RepID=A0A3M7S7T5_BRAPC|nr:hypothetical protein BpHYR1_020792 [Brachionus plicatilis]